MKTEKNSKFITIFIIGVFLILSYSLIKGFFGESTNEENVFAGNKKFSFIYDTRLLSDKNLDKMYDSTRTNRVVMKKNYERITGNPKKSLINLNVNNIDFYFSNGNEEPTYYKLSLKDIDYLNVYSINEKNNAIKFLILGSDLKYYNLSISINKLTENMDKTNKEWQVAEKSRVSLYPNNYYKVVDDYCYIDLLLPDALNEVKITELIYKELKEKILSSISVEKVEGNNISYKVDSKNIKLSDNITLLVKDNKIFQYYYLKDDSIDVSLMTIGFIKDNNVIVFAEIEDIDKYNAYLDSSGYKKKEYNYKGLEISLIYNDESITSNGIKYDSFIIKIDDRYYTASTYMEKSIVNDSSIDTWTDNLINGILDIK